MPNLIQSTDFLEYYTATIIFWNGQNSYDPQLMKNLQVFFGMDAQIPALMMWNPPLIMLFFLPFIFLPPDLAFICFTLLNILFLFDAIRVCFKLNGISVIPKKSMFTFVPILFMFVPLTFCLVLGQLGIVLFWAWLRFRLSIDKRNIFLASFFVLILCFKPHLFFIGIIVIFCREFFCKKSLDLFFKTLFSLSVAVLAIFIINQQSIFFWLESLALRDMSYYFIRPEDWKSSHVIFWISEVFAINLSLLKLAALVMFLVSLAYSLYRYAFLNLKNMKHLGSISVISSPFFWIFDCVVLLEPLLLSLYNLQENQKSILKVFALLSLMFTFIWSQAFGHYAFYHQLGWYPILMILSLFLLRDKKYS